MEKPTRIVKIKVPFSEEEIRAIKYVAEVYDPATPDISSVIRNITLKIVNAGINEIAAQQQAYREAKEKEAANGSEQSKQKDAADEPVNSAGAAKELRPSEATDSSKVEGQADVAADEGEASGDSEGKSEG